MPAEFKNYGLVNEQPLGDEELLGSNGLEEILQPNRDWTEFLPVKEYQGRPHETWNCTVFSLYNLLEIFGKRVYGIEINKSERFTGKCSGTVPRWGNTLRRSFEALPQFGWVDEKDYPFNSKTVEEYYKTIPPEVKQKGLESLKEVEFRRKLVSGGPPTPEQLWQALQFSPIRVTGRAWADPVNGVYQRIEGESNHAFVVFKGVYKKSFFIFDTYDNVIKELAWDFFFGSADIINFSFKNMNNQFVRIVKDEDSRAVGFFIPATSPDALTSMSLAYNKQILKTEDGEIDWGGTIEGTVKLKQPLN